MYPFCKIQPRRCGHRVHFYLFRLMSHIYFISELEILKFGNSIMRESYIPNLLYIRKKRSL